MRRRYAAGLATCALGVPLAVGLVAAALAAVSPTSVAPDVQVNPRSPSQNVEGFKSPSVAIDPGQANRVVIATRNDSPDYGCQIHYSTDGGTTWDPASFPPPPKGTCWSPGAAWDADGNVYVAAQNRPPRGGRQDIIVWRSSDGGQSFGEPVVIPDSAGFQAGIALDTHAGSPHRGRIYVTWYSFPLFPASIDTFLSFSDDGGATWSTPVSRPVAGQYQTLPQPAIAPDGTVYVVFKDTHSNAFTRIPGDEPEGCQGVSGAGDPADGAECEIRVLRSSDGGASFDADPFTVATANFNDLSVAEQPGIAINPDGSVLVTYSSIPTPPAAGCASDQDALVARSADRGVTWSPPLRLNDDPCAGGATQRNPWISVAPNGRVDAIFYDNRDDATEPRDIYGVRYANSTDGGQTFGPNLRVNEADFDTTTFFDPQGGGFQSNEFDQVNGIASTNAGAVGAWGDTRNAPSSSSTVSDVFSVGISFVIPGGDGGGLPGPGAMPTPVPEGEEGGDDRRGSRLRPNLVRPGFARSVQRGGGSPLGGRSRRGRRAGLAVARVSRSRRGGRVVVRLRGRMLGNRGWRCGGRIKIGTRVGRRRVATRKGRMGRDCRYRERYAFAVRRLPPRLRPRGRRLVLRVAIRYQGNSMLRGDLSPPKRIPVRR